MVTFGQLTEWTATPLPRVMSDDALARMGYNIARGKPTCRPDPCGDGVVDHQRRGAPRWRCRPVFLFPGIAGMIALAPLSATAAGPAEEGL